MLYKVILLLLLTLDLFSITLQSSYYVNSNNIKLLDIVPHAKYDVTIYKIDRSRYSKKVKSKELIKLLEKHDITDIKTSSRYIKFTKKSPIDTSKIKTEVINIYKEKYPDIKIKSLSIMPRGYIKTLPKNYKVNMHKKAHLSNSGTLNIKTPKKKKLFFDYIVDAEIDVYISKTKIKRGLKISTLNTIKKSVNFEKFKALPITVQQLNNTQIKRNINKDYIITLNDIETIDIVNKGSNVNVSLQNKNINISFSAKALQNGKLNDIIRVQKNSGEKIHVKVTGKNRAEIK
ncbi:flagellar basal body P-ring formation chaperone FlgA [Sulfurimonas sp.]